MSEPPEDPESTETPNAPRRAQRGKLVSAVGAVALLALMFLSEWYGVDGIPGRSEVSSAENAWHGLTVARWLMLLTIAVTLGSLVIHATQRTHGAQTETSGVVAVLGTLTAAVLTWRVLIVLPSPASVVDQKLGAYLGMLSAYVIALGGFDSIRSAPARAPLVRRPRRRVTAGGGRALIGRRASKQVEHGGAR
jgi:hypothetical protein